MEWPIFIADRNPYKSLKVKDFIGREVVFDSSVYKRCLAFQTLWASVYHNGGEFPSGSAHVLLGRGSDASLSSDQWGVVLSDCYGIGADAVTAIRRELDENEDEGVEQLGSDHVDEVAPVAHGVRSGRHGNRKTQVGSKPRPAIPFHGDRSEAYRCEDCNKYLSSAAGLRDHRRDKHN